MATVSFRHDVTCSFRLLPTFRSGVSSQSCSDAALLCRGLRVSQQCRGGPVSAQRAHLRVAEVCVGAFGVTTMTKAHELDFRIDPDGGFDLRYMPKEVPLFPGQQDAFESVGVVAGDDQRSVTIAVVETMHDVGPQRGPVVIVQGQVDHLARLVVDDSRYVWSIG